MSILACGMAIMTALGVPSTRTPVMREVAKYNSVELLVLAAIESRFDPGARSEVGAFGVMQLTPIAVKHVYEVGCIRKLPMNPDVTDMRTNILIGFCYFSYLQNVYNRDNILAVGAYNGGNRVAEKLKNFKPIPTESARHIVRFLNLKRRVPECQDFLSSQ